MESSNPVLTRYGRNGRGYAAMGNSNSNPMATRGSLEIGRAHV